jgi:geranylgeranyl diphosphate synthase type I
MDFNEFKKMHQKKVEEYIEKVILENKVNPPKQIESLIRTLIEYCLRPGKRIRPLLFLLGATSYAKKELDYEKLYRIAAVIEIMHCFLLIHDDIMDRSDLRRGLPSLHVVFYEEFKEKNNNEKIGEDLALVFGDILFFIAIRQLSKLNLSSKFLEEFSNCYINTGYGQTLDVLYSLGKYKPDEDKISVEIARLKTAYYTFFYPFYLGVLLSNENIDKKKIEDAIIPAGIAFQIRDDIISTFDEKSGKSNVTDILEGKLTALIDFGEYDEKFFEVYSKQEKSSEEIQYILDQILKSGAIKKAKNAMYTLFEESISKIRKLDLNDTSKDILIDLISRLRSD